MKTVLTRDQYEVMKFVAEVYGGVGNGAMYIPYTDIPLCAVGLMHEGGLIAAVEDKSMLYSTIVLSRVPFRWVDSDLVVQQQLGTTDDYARIPFNVWARGMGVVIVEEDGSETKPEEE